MSDEVVAAVRTLVRQVVPVDELEFAHRADALAWLSSTDDVFRRVPPRTPPTHLVAYFVLHDPVRRCVLLVDHRKAGLWLPTGGHVDVGEDPAATVEREVLEELGVPAVFADPLRQPLFVTVTETNEAPAARHTDVSLWYLLTGDRNQLLRPDPREFAAARWWTRAELDAADPALLEPHLARFLGKVDGLR